MKTALLVSLFITALSFAEAQPITQSHKDSLNQIVSDFYSQNLIIFKENSTKADVDKLFDMCTADFEYVHPRYGGTYSRQDLYEGYLNNQANGAYDGSIVDINISVQITGLNAVAVERSFVTIDDSGEQQEVDKGLTVFEFLNGKISRIIEYW